MAVWIGAVIALFHDVFLTIGFFAIFKLPFDLTSVAAILTIIGYSMNDTVVVFDRLRENLRKYKKMPLAELIDLSINETLSRTVITGITAIMALVGLALIGGGTLLSFSVAMIFGILIGTYSSIYVATPVILLWGSTAMRVMPKWWILAVSSQRGKTNPKLKAIAKPI